MNNETNFILRLYPLTKLTFAFCISMSVFFVSTYVYALACFALIMLLAMYTGVFKEIITLMLKTIFILIILMFIMQAMFYPGEQIIWAWKAISIKMEGIQYAISLSSKLLVISASIIYLFKTIHLKDFISSLEQAGVSETFTYVILSTIQIIPQLQKRSKVIMDAQKSRGVETEGNFLIRAKAFIPSIGPLILGSIIETEQRAITLEARAFSAPREKVRMHVIHDTKIDKILRITFLSMLVLIIIRRIVIWVL